MKDYKKIYQHPASARTTRSILASTFWDTYLHWGCIEIPPPPHWIYQRPIYSSPGKDIFVDTYLHWRCVEIGLKELLSAKKVQKLKENKTYLKVIELAKRGESQAEIAFHTSKSRGLISRYLKRAREEGKLKGELS